MTDLYNALGSLPKMDMKSKSTAAEMIGGLLIGLGLGIFICVAFVALWFVGALAKGFVLVKMWGWFVLPLFPTMPVLALWQAVGLSAFLSYLTWHGKTAYKDHKEEGTTNIVTGLLTPWIVLFFGWVVHLLIMG